MRLKPKLRGALLALLGVTLVLVGICICTGVRLGIWRYCQYQRYNWLTANLPIARELWHGNIKSGEDVEKLISQWHPHVTSRFGRWVRLDWYPGPSRDFISLIGICVIAKDGVLVQACSYSDDLVCAKTFFDVLTPQDQTRYRAALNAYTDGLRATGHGERELNKKAEESGVD